MRDSFREKYLPSRIFIFIFIFTISLTKGYAATQHWSYEDKTGPVYWPTMYKQCGGSRQSPINIVPREVDVNDDLNDFEFNSFYDDSLKNAIIENNGHTVQVSPDDSFARTFTEAGHDDVYEFLQLHFHWGGNSKRGSEHTIDGRALPLEMHLVHRNKNYKTFEAALQKEDGLAVLAVLFKLSNEDNDELKPIIDKLDDVRKEGDKTTLGADIDLKDLLPDDTMPYYRYRGSLTTPGCNEAVIWTVFKEFQHISESQLAMFRGVTESDQGEADEQLVDNYRPVQELGTRILELSPDEPASGASTTVTTSLFTLLVSIALLFRAN